MRIIITAVFLFIIMLSCNLKREKITGCEYKIDELFRDFDSTLLEKKIFASDGIIEFVDKTNLIGQKGIYKFDSDSILRVYAFLVNQNNDFFFSLEFDSLGNQTKKTGSEVIQWYFRMIGKDSIAITFLLSSINCNYKEIEIRLLDKEFKNIELLKSQKFSNIFSRTIDVPFKKENNHTVFIQGKKVNTCSGEIRDFKDSIQISPELYGKTALN